MSNAIGEVTAGNMFGGHPATFVANVYGWRVDRQNPPPGCVNLSVQRNGIGSPSTVATVFVPTAYNLAPVRGGTSQFQAHQARMRELQRKVRNGLEQSFRSLVETNTRTHTWAITRYEVYGEFSA